ncbi:MAG: hypothetical protein JST85_01895 [Acidobacteria bacterium]|nr:hypothetical protein [Acidobacteriota bacterium]
MKFLTTIFLLLFLPSLAFAQDDSSWRQATEKELGALIPSRAPVEKERIETELRSASGVTDGKGHFIAGVLLITAGYSAHGKYTHFFITQTPIRIGDAKMKPGQYVYGYRRLDDDTLEFIFYEAATGTQVGATKAPRESRTGPIRSLLITPPVKGKGMIQIGRFGCEYSLDKEK